MRFLIPLVLSLVAVSPASGQTNATRGPMFSGAPAPARAAGAAEAVPGQTEFLQNAITSLQLQRNEALDRAVLADVNGRVLAVENEKLKATIRELEAKAAAPKE